MADLEDDVSNRLESIFAELDRESEHKRRCDRVTRSREVYNAAVDEALQQDVILTANQTSYQMFKGEWRLWFYPATNIVYVQKHSETRSHQVPVNAEVDVFDVLLLFCEGKFQ